MIDFLNQLIISSDGIYGLRVIHIILLSIFYWMLPHAIRDMREVFQKED